ncbi:SigE family RNA polymerase sigma factor [Paractinoplanes durhamensis]|uniref:SigE family RNA polymerase sigma factor n=1 Tax=Paractinoplanes durhamensis TaxID=113563 RepID=UPI001942D599|nr:SigE family RNA polymerase sigma factor [Actinoplanes durhamensis]
MTFDDYVRLRGARLVQLARLLIRDRHLAEDLVQEVLSKAFVRWKKISAAGDPDMYVRRMLINSNISWWRRRSSSEIVTATIGDRSDDADLGDRTAGQDAAWRLIAELPPRQRATIVLRYFEDLSDERIAEILEISTVTVRSQAMRALEKLRRQLEQSPASIEGGHRR